MGHTLRISSHLSRHLMGVVVEMESVNFWDYINMYSCLTKSIFVKIVVQSYD